MRFSTFNHHLGMYEREPLACHANHRVKKASNLPFEDLLSSEGENHTFLLIQWTSLIAHGFPPAMHSILRGWAALSRLVSLLVSKFLGKAERCPASILVVVRRLLYMGCPRSYQQLASKQYQRPRSAVERMLTCVTKVSIVRHPSKLISWV